MNALKQRIAASLAALSVTTASLIGLAHTPVGAHVIAKTCNNSSACLQWTNTGTGMAIVGIANSNNGVTGKTSVSSSSGVYGEDDAASGGWAMYASSPNNGVGIFSYSAQNIAFAGQADAGIGLDVSAGANDTNPAILANSNNSNCIPACAPVIIASVSGTTHVMSLDTKGNMILSGSLTQNGSPQYVTRTRSGTDVVAYAARVSQPVMEDLGEATLQNGVAHVALEARFAGAIDDRARYLVFLTPQGATSGTLFVSEKSASGFTVRDTGAGSSIAFDYRIVAKPLDAAGSRLPIHKPLPQLHYPLPHRR